MDVPSPFGGIVEDMASGSSRGNIKQRAMVLAEEIRFWPVGIDVEKVVPRVLAFFEAEYAAIPEKERLGKGRVYIARAVVDGFFSYMKTKGPEPPRATPEDFLGFSQRVFQKAQEGNEVVLRYLAVFFLAEAVKKDPNLFLACEHQFLEWATDDDWEMREITLEYLVNGVKYYPDIVMPKVQDWVVSPNPNIRRFAAEGVRPRGGTRWLRDPLKNDLILEILGKLRYDPSEYVRKSVSNNIKDLTKYMSQKILALLRKWVRDADIVVTPDLASKSKAELGPRNFALIYIVKKALRWVKAKNPELHSELEKIIGANYIRYFDEKRNLLAKPK